MNQLHREHYKMIRQRYGVRLTNIAKKLRCTTALLSMYERGERNISPVLEGLYKEYIDKHIDLLIAK